jgi:hypothetical protein
MADTDMTVRMVLVAIGFESPWSDADRYGFG